MALAGAGAAAVTSTMHGGLELPANKAASTREPIARAPRPPELVLPLMQHAGTPAEPLVRPGDRVLRGQPLARAAGYVSIGVHAPASGTVIAVEPRPVPHPSGLDAPCVVVATDPHDEDWPGLRGYPDWRLMDPSALRNRVREAGIAGLGGAAFPTHVKLTPGGSPIHTLVLNGAECEPYISCDDMLMRERAGRVVAGIPIMLHALKATRCIVAIEEDKPEAIAAMQEAIAAHRATPASAAIELRVVPALYPQGAERQLIRRVLDVDVPRGKLPLDIGIVCHNVGTAAAVADAVLDGEPLTRRIVTVTGGALRAPRNVDALLGTQVSTLFDACGGLSQPPDSIVMGGPMMGLALRDGSVPVVKATNCVIAALPDEMAAARGRTPGPAMPCIRCGECATACPAELLPQELYRFAKAKDFERADAHALFDCIECGVCDVVCPSRLPLVATFRWAKGEIWRAEEERTRAELSKRRHDARQARLEAERIEREARLKRKQDPVSIDAALARIKQTVGP